MLGSGLDGLALGRGLLLLLLLETLVLELSLLGLLSLLQPSCLLLLLLLLSLLLLHLLLERLLARDLSSCGPRCRCRRSRRKSTAVRGPRRSALLAGRRGRLLGLQLLDLHHVVAHLLRRGDPLRTVLPMLGNLLSQRGNRLRELARSFGMHVDGVLLLDRLLVSPVLGLLLRSLRLLLLRSLLLSLLLLSLLLRLLLLLASHALKVLTPGVIHGYRIR